MEEAQRTLQDKFQKVVDGLTREIQEKDEMNATLGKEATELKTELA